MFNYFDQIKFSKDFVNSKHMNVELFSHFKEMQKFFLEHLRSLKTDFMEPIHNLSKIKEKEFPFDKLNNILIFSNLKDLIPLNEEFFIEISNENLDLKSFLPILCDFCSKLELYFYFCSNLKVSYQTLDSLLLGEPFKKFVQKLESQKKLDDLSFEALLFLPFQVLLFYSKFFDFLEQFLSNFGLRDHEENIKKTKDFLYSLLHKIVS